MVNQSINQSINRSVSKSINQSAMINNDGYIYKAPNSLIVNGARVLRKPLEMGIEKKMGITSLKFYLI